MPPESLLGAARERHAATGARMRGKSYTRNSFTPSEKHDALCAFASSGKLPTMSSSRAAGKDRGTGSSHRDGPLLAGSPAPASARSQAQQPSLTQATGTPNKPKGRKRRRSIDDQGDTSRDPADEDADGASGSDVETRRSALPLHPEAQVLRLKETVFQVRDGRPLLDPARSSLFKAPYQVLL